jgi:hypothetical protein
MSDAGWAIRLNIGVKDVSDRAIIAVRSVL